MYDFIIAEKLQKLRGDSTKEESAQLQLELPLVLGDRPARDARAGGGGSEPIVLHMSGHDGDSADCNGVLIISL